MTASTAPALGVTLTAAARHTTGQLTHQPYRDADTDTTRPHGDGCPCGPGEVGCDAHWDAWLHAIAETAVRTS